MGIKEVMKFLIIEQDLRVSGTSQGIISRSFLAKLRVAYPQSVIDVVYLKSQNSDDQLELLPIDSIKVHVLNLKIPFITLWLNKIYWRLFHISLNELHIQNQYRLCISKIDYKKYDHIFIRSAGLNHETILGSKDLPILKRSIVNFHDPYPGFWYAGSKTRLTKLEYFRLKQMRYVVCQAKTCMSSARLMSQDMQYLYGSQVKFFDLPHQYSANVFDLSDDKKVLKKKKQVTISYHGAIQFGRNLKILLEAYQELLEKDSFYKENTEFLLRLKGIDLKKLAKKYSKNKNIILSNTLNFSNSANEQKFEADINIIIENGPLYCNILVGKAPFLASLNKAILSVSPERSEMRKIIKDSQFLANCKDKEEIKQKLENLIIKSFHSKEPVYPFGDYFSSENFKTKLDQILF